ncbi:MULTISPECIES: hypothetical protein [Nitrosomonas]|uniref:hypothetical protein n=1 Tax=Nitrosomonas TaxID=914 RepID=UPI0011876156|nr:MULTISPECIES: hypothetical protein [Nitrosomonas]UVS60598.1 hypothetical protein NX761_13965 [Nitrosomonas sp. PLL12]
MPPIHMPLRLLAAILSRMRSPVTSLSNNFDHHGENLQAVSELKQYCQSRCYSSGASEQSKRHSRRNSRDSHGRQRMVFSFQKGV